MELNFVAANLCSYQFCSQSNAYLGNRLPKREHIHTRDLVPMVSSRPNTNTTGLALKLLAALVLAPCFCITNSAYDNCAIEHLSKGFLDSFRAIRIGLIVAYRNQAVSTVPCPCEILFALDFLEERIYRGQPLAISWTQNWMPLNSLHLMSSFRLMSSLHLASFMSIIY